MTEQTSTAAKVSYGIGTSLVVAGAILSGLGGSGAVFGYYDEAVTKATLTEVTDTKKRAGPDPVYALSGSFVAADGLSYAYKEELPCHPPPYVTQQWSIVYSRTDPHGTTRHGDTVGTGLTGASIGLLIGGILMIITGLFVILLTFQR